MKYFYLLALAFSSHSALAKLAVLPPQELQELKKFQILNKNLKLTNAKGVEINALEPIKNNTELKEWHHLSPDKGIEGVQSQKAYDEFKLDHAVEVIVAVIDSGVDISHEDLEGKIWVNTAEIPDNQIDDDKNGYVDDVNGWNFLGNANGENISADSLEVTREYVRLSQLKTKLEAEGKTLNAADAALLAEVSEEVNSNREESEGIVNQYSQVRNQLQAVTQTLIDAGVTDFTKPALAALVSIDPEVLEARDYYVQLVYVSGLSVDYLDMVVNHYQGQLDTHYNPDFDPRGIVGDDYLNGTQKGYGNNNVTGPDASHGTHVAGIIAANRDNDLGIKGIAQNVKIMAVRAVPDGDERDKDVANAIIYAVDNGAQIINMSFGKAYSPYKELVDNAVKYANKKGVLLVHAAGNSHQNNDLGKNYPTDTMKDGTADIYNWIEVGASTWESGLLLTAPFSNYGKVHVDIFAPGFQITSSTPGNNYAAYNGTSMAAPTVAGVAALIISQNAALKNSARGVKDLILQTSRRHAKQMIIRPSEVTGNLAKLWLQLLTGENQQNPVTVIRKVTKKDPIAALFGELSVTGGIADVYSALAVDNLALKN